MLPGKAAGVHLATGCGSISLLALIVLVSNPSAEAADLPNACFPVIGRIVSMQGSIEVLRSGQAQWMRVQRLDTPICQSDKIRAGRLSRAALFLNPEIIVRVDQNTTLSVVQTETETQIEVAADEA